MHGYTRRGIMCQGGVDIPFRQVKPAVSPNSSSGKRFEYTSYMKKGDNLELLSEYFFMH
jgi:hypothetical protein